MIKLSVPEPCHEDWGAMTPEAKGRHCAVCCKTVVDFTQMSEEDIKAYFAGRAQGSTCGRFLPHQLSPAPLTLSPDILYTTIPLWKKFLAACLMAFGTFLLSCNDNIKINGKPTTGEINDARPNPSIDTAKDSRPLMGDTIAVQPGGCSIETVNEPDDIVMGVMVPPSVIDIKGDVSVEPTPVVEPVYEVVGKPAYVPDNGSLPDSQKVTVIKDTTTSKRRTITLNPGQCDSIGYY